MNCEDCGNEIPELPKDMIFGRTTCEDFFCTECYKPGKQCGRCYQCFTATNPQMGITEDQYQETTELQKKWMPLLRNIGIGELFAVAGFCYGLLLIKDAITEKELLAIFDLLEDKIAKANMN